MVKLRAASENPGLLIRKPPPSFVYTWPSLYVFDGHAPPDANRSRGGHKDSGDDGKEREAQSSSSRRASASSEHVFDADAEGRHGGRCRGAGAAIADAAAILHALSLMARSVSVPVARVGWVERRQKRGRGTPAEAGSGWMQGELRAQ